MKKKLAILLLIASSIFGVTKKATDTSVLVVCQADRPVKNIENDDFKPQEISAEELLAKLQNDAPNTLVANVLGKRYYDDAHIVGSVSAPLKVLDQIAKGWDKNKLVIVYCACRECDASLKAAKMLVTMGFLHVLAYEGGIREWYKKGYPCGGPCKEPYLNEEGDSRSTKLAYCFCAEACSCVA